MIAGVRSQKPNRLLGLALPESLLPWEDTKDTKAMSSTHLATFPPQAQMQEGLSPGHSKRKLENGLMLLFWFPPKPDATQESEAPPHVGGEITHRGRRRGGGAELCELLDPLPFLIE